MGIRTRHLGITKGLAPEHHECLLDVNILHNWFKHSATTTRLTYISDNLICVPVCMPLSVPHLPSSLSLSHFRLSGCLIVTLSCCPTASLSLCLAVALPHCLVAPLPHCLTAPLPHSHCLTAPLPHRRFTGFISESCQPDVSPSVRVVNTRLARV